jgi:heme exporter protein A
MLELQSVACDRGGRTLFGGLSLQLGAGRLLRVSGVNGAGKTSLLRMICGLLPPTDGAVLWQGQNIASLRDEFNRQLVYLGHAAALKDELSALENLQTASILGGRSTGLPDAMQALAQAGLRGREQVPVRTLSQGQRRRAALARLELCVGVPLWVLDEPFNALDTSATAWLLALLERQLGAGAMVVLTSHQSLALPAQVAQQELAL